MSKGKHVFPPSNFVICHKSTNNVLTSVEPVSPAPLAIYYLSISASFLTPIHQKVKWWFCNRWQSLIVEKIVYPVNHKVKYFDFLCSQFCYDLSIRGKSCAFYG